MIVYVVGLIALRDQDFRRSRDHGFCMPEFVPGVEGLAADLFCVGFNNGLNAIPPTKSRKTTECTSARETE